ncbi:hypothetical protein [Acinetobacter pittii]|uniref:hypothetical protein n=1 Tax=Acinetobacter pittii TaxID=48296 RepID=UPI0024DEEF59|nr:hypothetical protein [Acinetobacter pittii]
MTTMFIDTYGEMSFVDNERLKFIMHYLKQGADDSLVEMKDGRFVREDSELSFTEIWLPSAEHQQRKIDEQQAKVEELEGRNQMLSDCTLEMGSKHIRDTDLINQQASTLFRLREFIYGSGDLREYSDEELLEHQRILKAIVTGEQALKGEG